MDWRLKCLAFHLLEWLPKSRGLHGFLQRHVTGRYYQTVTDDDLDAYGYHVRNMPAGAVVLEFGAGRNLLSALLLSHAGAARVYALDLDRLATVEQVNAIILRLREKLPGDWPAIGSLDDLAPLYRIEYRAPADARATGLPDGSVDLICSTSVLEHIPPDQIRAILTESKRIASERAVMSFVIDYHDHYATADSSITRVNFYRYPEKKWTKFNPSAHYQNRMRHSDYTDLFHALGLEVSEARVRVTPVEIDRALMAESFRRYSDEDLAALNGFFTLSH